MKGIQIVFRSPSPLLLFLYVLTKHKKAYYKELLQGLDVTIYLHESFAAWGKLSQCQLSYSVRPAPTPPLFAQASQSTW